jgi:hypothetical protein
MIYNEATGTITDLDNPSQVGYTQTNWLIRIATMPNYLNLAYVPQPNGPEDTLRPYPTNMTPPLPTSYTF